MAKKNITTTEGKTLEQIMQELRTAVDEHNGTEVASERVTAAVKVAKLKDDYNKASLLKAYSECLEAENPMLTFIKKYQYPVVSTGTKKDNGNISIKDDGTAVFNLWNFVEWCEGRNHQVVVNLDWKSKAEEARKALLTEGEKYIETGNEFNVGAVKDAIQAMFNSIVMVAGESGNNAVIAKSKNVRVLKMTCAKVGKDGLSVQFGAGKTWQARVFSFLHLAVDGKNYTMTYGDPEKEAPAAAEPEVETDEVSAE